ncbi:serine/threonine-protein kinase [Paucibacter sediminis]|uniref:Serine/threonine-protein kinase n=1 Tax=Paucibacter sediminis TaxID=3019553 RepID=A0AA95NIX8_9BURK|nr:serine/threonine-protein kinase [Paucibacter sp. S2-9]WIT11731.1 serine/threonine-protein kinase [Paucibacter sp. S2-9]
MSSSSAADPDFAQVKALFNEICDLPDEAAQRRRLAELGAPAQLCARVLRLAGHDATTRFAKPVAGMLASVGGAELRPGERLGAWTLVSELGHGGMGMVYLAERSDGHYQQRAAIKLLRGWSGEAALAQLARERQILASLNHPHIARLIDGGSTPGGQPYLVMDYVEGQRIDVYQHEHELGLEATLELFLMVCEAVAYAHRQLVVHCDIKPGNVLVGSDGRAMLLDFGIAQLQGKRAESGVDGSAQDGETLALTPRYASPEQRAGAPASSASDIYSLGAMLGELLQALGPAAARPAEWQAIVRRATAAQPEARYLSVAALMSDLRRYRQHLPLAALPRSPGYVARKFLRRRWPWVLAGSGALLMAALFTLRVVQERDRALQAEALARASAAQAERSAAQAQGAERHALAERDQAAQARAQAQHERDAALAAEARADAERRRAEAARRLAQQEAETTRQVSDFMVALFEGADPRVSGRPDLSAATLVDKGRERMDRDLQGQPALQASMKGVLGKVYENIGKPRAAVELYEQAIALERAKPQRQPLREAALLSRLAVTLSNDGQEAKAVAPARRSLALRQPLVAADALELADAYNTLGLVLTRVDALDEARRCLDKALAIRLARQGAEHLDVAIAIQNLGSLALRAGQLREAEAQFRRALELKRRLLGEQNPSVLTSMQSLAVVLAAQHRVDEAEALLRELVAQRRAVHGPQSATVASALNELASVLQDGGRSAEAIAAYREALALHEQLQGRGSVSVAVNINNLATALEDLGDPAAESLYRESLAIRQAALKPDDLSLARARHNLGRWLLRAGRLAEAQPLLEEAAVQRRKRLPAVHNDRIDSELTLAEAALLQGDSSTAAAGVALVQAQEAALRPLRRVALLRLQGLLASHLQQAQQALEHHQAALQLALATVAPEHPSLRRLRLDVAEAAAALARTLDKP